MKVVDSVSACVCQEESDGGLGSAADAILFDGTDSWQCEPATPSSSSSAAAAAAAAAVTSVSARDNYVTADSTLVHLHSLSHYSYRVGQKTGPFLKCITFLYNDLGRQSIYQNVQLFIGSKNDILNAAVFKYSLHKVRETTLH